VRAAAACKALKPGGLGPAFLQQPTKPLQFPADRADHDLEQSDARGHFPKSAARAIRTRRITMKYGARNQLKGKVIEIKKGKLMCQVKVQVAPGAAMSSVMTLDSLKELGLKKGSTVKILVKAVNVLLATE
jgi:molybdopterin-binding protein